MILKVQRGDRSNQIISSVSSVEAFIGYISKVKKQGPFVESQSKRDFASGISSLVL